MCRDGRKGQRLRINFQKGGAVIKSCAVAADSLAPITHRAALPNLLPTQAGMPLFSIFRHYASALDIIDKMAE